MDEHDDRFACSILRKVWHGEEDQMSNPGPFSSYLQDLRKNLATGAATELTHRSALEALVEAIADDIQVINEPKRAECGAPDFVVTRDDLTIGYVEAKDIGKSLDQAEGSAQLRRYRRNLENLILTDYLEFRWYVNGECRRTGRVARLDKKGRLLRDKDGLEVVTSLLRDFLSQPVEPISTPRELAEHLARLTHQIRDIVVEAFENGKASDVLRDLRKAFASSLIPDLYKPEKTTQFADMYAQTIAYGLFAARCNHRGPGAFQRIGAAAEIPKTNPFLRKLLETITGTELDDEPYAGFVDDLVQLLGNADMEAVLEHFGKRTRREDPVVHFYETFLATYDPDLRERRGVYYTPYPVVSYIVRSLDHLIRTRFDLPNGLADTATVGYELEETGQQPRRVRKTAPRVLVLDPACGTGTFLYAMVDHIRNQFMQRGRAGMWSSYVREHLLPRLFGFEILMAPYAIAHFKLGMQLAGHDLSEAQQKKWAYDFSGDERLGIYLTNTLEEAERRTETLFGPLRVITEEAVTAGHVKRDLPIMVILGNPPYSTFGKMNKGRWIMGLTRDWKPPSEKKWNPDDFMKFMRWAQWRIERTGAGILAYITNNSYIDGVTHRRMRQSLMNTFTEIYILDLHGSSMKRERCPDGSKDENVFDIRPGVAIGLFVKEPGRSGPAKVRHAELWGLREAKYEELFACDVGMTQWTELKPKKDWWFFVPIGQKGAEEYHNYESLTTAFELFGNGIGTDRDSLFYDDDYDTLAERIKRFYSAAGTRERFAERYGVRDSSSYPLLARRQSTSFSHSRITRSLYRPFDTKWLYYDPSLTSRPAHKVMQHLTQENIGLLVTRQVSTGTFRHVFVSAQIVDRDPLSLATRERTQVFPLYMYASPEDSQRALFTADELPRRSNFAPEFIAAVADKLVLDFVPEGKGDLEGTFGPEDILHYAYAVFHSPTYRERYAEFLKIDFPRLPLTSDLKLFRALAEKGKQLVALHLMESPRLNDLITSFPVKGSDEVVKVRYAEPRDDVPGRVHINKTQYFEGVQPDVWEFQIGGYQVLHKWLKDRKGRVLSFDDLSRTRESSWP